MAATNFILTVYSKLLALLEAHSPVAGKLKIGNEVREDQSKLYPRSRGAKLPADFPQVYLTVGDTNGRVLEQTFAFEDIDFDPTQGGWLEGITQTFEIKIVHEALNLSLNSIFEAEVFTALRKGGPRLGQSFVVGWSYIARRTETTKGAAGGTLRQITIITVPVEMQFEGADLVI